MQDIYKKPEAKKYRATVPIKHLSGPQTQSLALSAIKCQDAIYCKCINSSGTRMLTEAQREQHGAGQGQCCPPKVYLWTVVGSVHFNHPPPTPHPAIV